MWPGSVSSRSGVFSCRATGRCPTSGSKSPAPGVPAPCSAACCCCAIPCTAAGMAGCACLGAAAAAAAVGALALVATRGRPAGAPASAALRSRAICLSRVEAALSLLWRPLLCWGSEPLLSNSLCSSGIDAGAAPYSFSSSLDCIPFMGSAACKEHYATQSQLFE